jgi:hypothetical protein
MNWRRFWRIWNNPMRAYLTPCLAFILLAFFIGGEKAHACRLPPAVLTAAPDKILAGLEDEAGPYLAAMDDYSIAMEACYDGALGPLELAPFAKAAAQLDQSMHHMRTLAEDRVRGNEFDYEDLLSSDLWADIEAMRVAASYAVAWSALAGAVRHISANDKRQALSLATQKMQQLSFEFKHPVLVQRAMYGLASAQIEGGRLAAAKETLTRLRQSLARAGAPDFRQSVDMFYARITAPGYQPPAPLFAEEAQAQISAAQSPLTGRAADDAVRLARTALGEGRPAAEIIGLLEPALKGTAESARAALALIARDQLLLRAMDYAPGPALRVMQRAFSDGQYAQIVASWPDLKPYYQLLPDGLKRRVDYQMGVARLNLGALDLALDHLRAARRATPNAMKSEAVRLDKLIVLAQLSADKMPDENMLALARQYHRKPKFIEVQKPIDAPPPTPEEVLEDLLDLRARIVLARHATQAQNWVAADGYLTGIGPDEAAYQLFLGMRVRLLAEAIKGRLKAGESEAELRVTARGGHILYRLWRASTCAQNCPHGNRLAVHRAAFEIAFMAQLDGTAFGFSWAGFIEDGGDVRPFIPQALRYLMTRQDGARLMVILEAADEELAAVALGHWKTYLRTLHKKSELAGHYDFLSGLIDLQGRPQAVLLEALIEHDLAVEKPQRALAHAETLAARFPRRPAAWFWRAASLQANQRGLEAARTLSSLAQRTPADDPVGMGARLGLAALFIELERGPQACAMQQKIFSRPQAQARWQDAVTAFPLLKDWQGVTRSHCG